MGLVSLKPSSIFRIPGRAAVTLDFPINQVLFGHVQAWSISLTPGSCWADVAWEISALFVFLFIFS